MGIMNGSKPGNVSLCEENCLKCSNISVCLSCPIGYYLSLDGSQNQICLVCNDGPSCLLYNTQTGKRYENDTNILLDFSNAADFNSLTILIYLNCSTGTILANNYTCLNNSDNPNKFIYSNPKFETLTDESLIELYVTKQTDYHQNISTRNFSYLYSSCPQGYTIALNFSACDPCPDGCAYCHYASISSNNLTSQIMTMLQTMVLISDYPPTSANIVCDLCFDSYVFSNDGNKVCMDCSTIDQNCVRCDYGIIQKNSTDGSSSYVSFPTNLASTLYCTSCIDGYGVISNFFTSSTYPICNPCLIFCSKCYFANDVNLTDSQVCFECGLNYNGYFFLNGSSLNGNGSSSLNGSSPFSWNSVSILDWTEGKCYFYADQFQDSNNITYNGNLLTISDYRMNFGRTSDSDFQSLLTANSITFTGSFNSSFCSLFGRLDYKDQKFLFCMKCPPSPNTIVFPYLNFSRFSWNLCSNYSMKEYNLVLERVESENMGNLLQSQANKKKVLGLLASNANLSSYEDNYTLYDKNSCYYKKINFFDGNQYCIHGPVACDPAYCTFKPNSNFFNCSKCLENAFVYNYKIPYIYNEINYDLPENATKYFLPSNFTKLNNMLDMYSGIHNHLFTYNPPTPANTSCYACKSGCSRCKYEVTKKDITASSQYVDSYSSPNCTHCFSWYRKVNNYVFDFELNTCKYCPFDWQACKAFLNKTIYINCSLNSSEIIMNQTTIILNDFAKINEILGFYFWGTLNDFYLLYNEFVVQELNITFIVSSDGCFFNDSFSHTWSQQFYLKSVNLFFIGAKSSGVTLNLGTNDPIGFDLTGYNSVVFKNLIFMNPHSYSDLRLTLKNINYVEFNNFQLTSNCTAPDPNSDFTGNLIKIDTNNQTVIVNSVFDHLHCFKANYFITIIETTWLTSIQNITVSMCDFSQLTRYNFVLIEITDTLNPDYMTYSVGEIHLLNNSFFNIQIVQFSSNAKFVDILIFGFLFSGNNFTNSLFINTEIANVALNNITNLTMKNNLLAFETSNLQYYFISGVNIDFTNVLLSQNIFSGGSFAKNSILVEKLLTSIETFYMCQNISFLGNVFQSSEALYIFNLKSSTNSKTSKLNFTIQNVRVENNTFDTMAFFYLPSSQLPNLLIQNISFTKSLETTWIYIESIPIVSLYQITIARRNDSKITRDYTLNSNAIYIQNFQNAVLDSINVTYFVSSNPIVFLEVVDYQNVIGNVSLRNSYFGYNYLLPESYDILSVFKVTTDLLYSVVIDSTVFESNFVDTMGYSFLQSTSALYVNINADDGVFNLINSKVINCSPPNVYISSEYTVFLSSHISNAKYQLPISLNHSITAQELSNMSSQSQTAFGILEYSELKLLSSIFENTENTNAGGFILKGNTNITIDTEITNCIFRNLYSETDGGAIIFLIVVQESYNIFINQSSFVNVTSENRGNFFFDGKNNFLELFVQNTNFTNCYAGVSGSIIYMDQGNVTSISFSNIFVKNETQTANLLKNAGNFFHIFFDSDDLILTLWKIQVSNIFCDCSIFYHKNCTFYFSDSLFESNTFGQKGLLYLENMKQNTTIKNVNFTSNAFQSQSSLSTGDLSSFWNFSYVKFSTITIISPVSYILVAECNFVNNSCPYCLAGAIFFYISKENSAINIIGSIFNSNKASIAGAMCFYKTINSITNNIFVIDSDFNNNNAEYFGGALYIYNGWAILSGLNFVNNSITSFNKTPYISSNLSDQFIDYSYSIIPNKGGAIFFESSSTINSSVSLNSSKFEDNIAAIGGAIYYNMYPIMSISDSNFSNNNATLYGNDNYSSPIKIKMTDETKKAIDFNSLQSGGVLSEISFQLLDGNDQILSIFEESIEMTIEMVKNSVQANQVCGLSGNTISTQNNSYSKFSFKNLEFYGNSNEDYTILVKTSAIINSKYTYTFLIRFRECLSGEYNETTLNICQDCINGYYSLEPQAKSCKVCDMNSMFECEKNIIKIRKYFWRKSSTSDVIEECLVTKDLCNGDEADQDNFTHPCSIGHIGAVCGSCDIYKTYWNESWAKKSKFTCGTCSDLKFNMSILISLLIFNLISIGVSVKGVVNMIDSEVESKTFRRMGFFFMKKEHKKTSIYLKIFMTYFQIISCITSFDLKLPAAINVFPDTIGNPTETLLFSTDCFVVDLIKSPPFIYIKAFITFLTPLIYLILFVFIYYVLVASKVLTNRPRIFYTAAFFVVIYLQPNVISILISILSCQMVANTPYVKADLAYECYTEEHTFYSLTFSLPALLVWAFFLPFIIFYGLYKARHHLEFIEYKIKYGFLYNEYKQRTFYWEFVKMIEKLCITVFLGFFDSQKILKGMLILMTIFFYFWLLLYLKPYKTTELNRIDIASNVICYITIFFAIFCYNNAFPSLLYVSYAIIILMNVAFIYVVGKKLLVSILKDEIEKLNDNRNQLKKILPCCFFWLSPKKIYKTLPLWRKVRKAVLKYLNAKYAKRLKNNSKKIIDLEKSVVRRTTTHFKKKLINDSKKESTKCSFKPVISESGNRMIKSVTNETDYGVSPLQSLKKEQRR